jgi:hypothetical protein
MSLVPHVNIHEHLHIIHLFAIFYQSMVALNGNTLYIEHKIIASITTDLVFNKIFQLYCDLY